MFIYFYLIKLLFNFLDIFVLNTVLGLLCVEYVKIHISYKGDIDDKKDNRGKRNSRNRKLP